MTASPIRISGILVVHNEEQHVHRCLASMAPVCDELLVAHDGPCRDRSLEIARQFTPHVFVHESRGAPEINRIKLLRRTSHDWVLRLDCDEALSPPLIERLQAFKQAPADGVVQLSGIWRAIYSGADESPARPHERATRIVLFRKSRSRWIGLPHSPLQIDGPSLPIRECIYHYAPHQSFSTMELITRKLYPFSKRDAELRLKHPIEQFGYDGMPIEQVLRPVDRWYCRHPLAVGVLYGGTNFLRTTVAACRTNNLRELRANLRWPVPHAVYQLCLGYHLHQLKRQGHRPTLAARDAGQQPA